MTHHATHSIVMALLSILACVLLLKPLALALFMIAVWHGLRLLWPPRRWSWCFAVMGSTGRLTLSWMAV